MDLPGHNAALAPGMTQVIVSGESYTIKDDNGAELELVGRDRPWVIAFIQKFDEYMEAAGRLGDDNVHAQAFAKALRDHWLAIPDDLAKQLPSYKLRCITIDVHAH